MSPSPRSILLVPPGRASGVADEALLSALCGHLRALRPSVSLTAITSDPDGTANKHGISAIALSNSRALSEALGRADLIMFLWGEECGDLARVLPEPSPVPPPAGLLEQASLAAAAALQGVPSMLCAAGIDPRASAEAREAIAVISTSAAAITAADEVSEEFLRSLGGAAQKIHRLADPCFALAPVEASRAAIILGAEVALDRRPLVGLSLQNWVTKQGASWETRLSAAMDLFLERCPGNILVVPFRRSGGFRQNDDAVSYRVVHAMAKQDRVVVLNPGYTPREVCGVLGSCDLVLAMRDRARVFSAATGTPFLALGGGAREREIMERLGLPESLIGLKDLDPGFLCDRMLEALQQAQAIRKTLREGTMAFSEEAHRHAQLASSLLDVRTGSRPEGGKSEALLRAGGILAARLAEAEGRLSDLEDRLEGAARYSQLLVSEREKLEAEKKTSFDRAEEASLPRESSVPRTQFPTHVSGQYDVIVFSIIDWDFRFQRPQQIALQFARHGHRVFYLSTSQFLPLDQAAWRLTDKVPNVWELNLRSARALNIYRDRLADLDLDLLEDSFRSFAKNKDIRQAVCLIQIPFWAPLALRLREKFGWRIVYDCMDEWMNFPGWGAEVLALEAGLVGDADLTAVTAGRLASKWEDSAPHLALVPNGIDLAHYQSRYAEDPRFSALKHPIIGFFGALASWVDVPLLEKIGRRFSGATLLLAGEGFDVDLSRLSALPNVRLTGKLPYEDMPRLLWAFDVCLIPFQVNAITEATNPVKFYEYCFSGKPIVAPDLAELSPFREVVYLASGHDAFLEQVYRALKEPPGDPRRETRRKIAAAADWDLRFQGLDHAIREILSKETVVVSSARLRRAFRHKNLIERELHQVVEGLHEQISSSGHELAELQLRFRGLQERYSFVSQELIGIRESRIWKMAHRYWALRRRLAAAAGRLRPKNARVLPAPPVEPVATLALQVEAPPRPRAHVRAPNRCDVVSLPIIEWDFLFQRPQQLMSQFARAGHRVFYVAPSFRPAGPPYELRQRGENVFEVSLRGAPLNVYRESLAGADLGAALETLDLLRREQGLQATALFVELPFWWPLAKDLRARYGWPVIYNCMDDHAGFSTNRPEMLKSETELTSGASLVAASSPLLEEKVRKLNSNVLLLRNAGDFAHFSRGARKPESGSRPVIGYFGSVSDWFDSGLVAELAVRRPDYDFILVGNTHGADLRQLSKLANVRIIGQRPYEEVPNWLAKFDVSVIPFKRMPLTEATNPVKAYEMLASGKPVVSVPIPEMVAMRPLVRLASTAAEFETQIIDALAESNPEIVEERKRFASENTWAKRFSVLGPAVRDLFPLASVIIVTFNNLELNKLCLESLFGRTEWPSLEVIAVDNGSDDGTVEYLREAERQYSGLRVLLNETNLGFAAASNRGLKEARGEYLVLLNNDTVLTRGWLTALIRHLSRSPKIGMINPSSNEIANEAKVPVGYVSLEDMPAWAEAFVRENDGRSFSVRTIPMFCAAMRREVMEGVGLLDERFEIGMFEDDDYARRLRAEGFDICCARDSFVHHAGRASFKLLGDERYFAIFERNRRLYEEKWGERWQPHLSEEDRGRVPALRERLNGIAADSGIEKGRTVVFLPGPGWNTPDLDRSQALARELARQGYLVFFDCSGSIPDRFSDFINAEGSLWLYKGPGGVLETLDGAILWADPSNANMTDRWKAKRVVYDWHSALAAFHHNSKVLEARHREMLDRADIVLCGSSKLREELGNLRSDALCLPNGVDEAMFSTPSGAFDLDPAFLAVVGSGQPIALIHGALLSWLDTDLLSEVADRRRDWNFIVIGAPAPVSKRLSSGPNILLLPSQRYEALPAYLARSTAAAIPLKMSPVTEASSPPQLYEALAVGKPVISAPIPDCEAFSEVHIVRGTEEFSRALDLAQKEATDASFRTKLQDIARRNSWSARVQRVKQALEVLAKKRGGEEPGTGEPSAGGNGGQAEANYEAVREKFKALRTAKNPRFFDALARHLAPLVDDPCLQLYFEFNIKANERGQDAARYLKRYVRLKGRNYLDVGCGCGGFLVGFAAEGAKVTGIDVVPSLLDLARENLRDNELECPVLLKNAEVSRDVQDLAQSFDVITCNDVAEHVADPSRLLRNVAQMLRSGGFTYFEIPNGRHPGHILEDGHYKLFGITLLDYEDARRYFEAIHPGRAYDTRHYLELGDYTRLFREAGLTPRVLDETFENIEVGGVRKNIARLRAAREEGLARVPEALRALVKTRLDAFLEKYDSDSRSTAGDGESFALRYGASHWRILGQAGC
jgi:GT2 family glycosyltransferase/2-polyprenyl-3-methyl-5-hydroxy-6-metoxy-1,4-benzoquinol methylase/polysaccharide pyruvyl transferase WcaK-like protein